MPVVLERSGDNRMSGGAVGGAGHSRLVTAFAAGRVIGLAPFLL
jgi:hypothetical protein